MRRPLLHPRGWLKPETEEEIATKDDMDAIRLLRKVVEQQDSDVLRELMKVFLDMLMSAEADTICGAGFHERSAERALVAVIA